MKQILSTLLLLCGLSLLSPLQAQLIVTQDTTICLGDTVTLQSAGSSSAGISITTDDVYSSVINLPFPFTFYGNTYTTCLVSSNGYIQFGNDGDANNYSSWSITTGIPGNINVLNSAMGFYADIYPPAGGNIYYNIGGIAPNRIFYVTWCNVPMFSCNTLLTTFQIILHETTGNIEYQIQNAPLCSSWNSGRAIQGVQNANGTAATWTTVPQVRNFPNQWSAMNDGQLYTPNGTTSYTVNQIPFSLLPSYPNITWYENGVTNLGTNTTIQVSPQVTTFYVAKPGSVTGCYTNVPADTVWVYVSVPNTPVGQADVTYCQNDPAAQLEATLGNPADTLKWYTSPTGGVGSNIAPTPNTSVPGETWYYVSEVNPSGCEGYRDAIKVTVKPTPPAPTVSTPVIYCQYDTAMPLQGPPAAFWYTSAFGGVPSLTAPTPNTAIAGTTTYYASSAAGGCESPRVPINVTVHPEPPKPGVTPTVHLCQFQPGQALTANGTGLLWYSSATGGTGSPVAPFVATDTPEVYNYFVSQTINGCEGQRAKITVTVDPKPLIPIAADTVYYCQDLPAVPLTAQGSNIRWYNSATGGTGSTVAPTPSTSAPGISYYYSSQIVNGCESDRKLTVVIVKPRVVAEFTVDKPVICNTDTLMVTFTGQAPTLTNFVWNFGPGSVRNNAVGAGPYYVYYANSGNPTIRLELERLGCRDTFEKTIRVDTMTYAYFDMPEEACVGEQVRIQAGWVSAFQDDYYWDFAGANSYGNGQGTHLATWNTPGDKIVKLEVQIGACRTYPAYDTIRINPLPYVDITTQLPPSVCTDDTVRVQVVHQPGYIYDWRPKNYLLTSNETGGAVFIARANAQIAVYVADSNGCKSADSIALGTEPCCTVTLPSAFTPNGDGKNDVFRIVTDGYQKISTFRIVNRWGVTVFQTENPLQPWDGTTNGVPQDMGTYMYYLSYTCNGKVYEMTGDVTLIR